MNDTRFLIIGKSGKRTVSDRMFAVFLMLSIVFLHLSPLVALAGEEAGETDASVGNPELGEDDSETDDEGSEDGAEEDGSDDESDDTPSDDVTAEPAEEEPGADIVNENESVSENGISAESDTGGNVIGTGEGTDGTESSGDGCGTDEEETDPDEGACASTGDGDAPTPVSDDDADGTEPVGDAEADPEETLCGTGPDTGSEVPCGAPESVIDTGDAVADATLVTDVNVNIVGEGVVKEVVDLSGHTEGDVNLLEDFLALGSDGESDDDEGLSGASDGLSVANGNVAEISNVVTAIAETGMNAIVGSDGDASVATGDALALAALVNMVNINLVGGNGLFSVINNFGEWVGDIVLPGDGLLSLSGGGSPLRVVENSNVLELTETVSASASTGGNLVEGGGSDASASTGDAFAVAKSETLANVNLVGDAWLYFLLNDFGTWIGQVIDGDEVVGDSFSYSLGGGTGADGEDGGCVDPDCADIVSVSNGNTAVIRNTVVAAATTGDNAITDAGGDAAIGTGDATAVAGVFNLANVNIVGSDWLFGVFNNFGTWRGNLVFAYPDLEVSIDDGTGETYPGEDLTYRVSVENVGRAEAKDVSFSLRLPEGFLTGDPVPGIPGRLAPGEEFSFELSGKVPSDAVGTTFRADVSASTGTTEKHGENNTDTDETDIVLPDPVLTRVSDDSDDDDEGEFSIRRETFGSDRVAPGGTVGCRITLMNDGDTTLYDVEIEDAFTAPDGFGFNSYLWDVGELAPDEGIVIEYGFQAGDTSVPGRYVAMARATGHGGDDDEVKSRKAYAAFTVIPVTYAETLSEEETGSVPQILGTAEAAPATLGVSETAKRDFPIWMLLLSGLAYTLIINWSFFPDRKKTL